MYTWDPPNTVVGGEGSVLSYTGFTMSGCLCFSVGDTVSGLELQFAVELQFHGVYGHGQKHIGFQQWYIQNFRLVYVCPAIWFDQKG